MRIKTVVGLALAISAFITGNIALFGKVSASMFPAAYLLFTSAVFAAIIITAKNAFRSKGDLAFVLVTAVALSFFLSFFAGNLRSYYENSYLSPSGQGSITDEISYLSAKNAYYQNYMDYITARIRQFQGINSELQAKINEALATPPAAPAEAAAIAPQQETPPIQYEEYYEDDRREEGDDD